MAEGSWVNGDVDELFDWLQQFEATVRGPGGGKRWYRSNALHAQVCYSWFDQDFAGAPAICVRDVFLVHPLNGLALLQGAAESFARGLDPLDAEVLVMRQPHGAQLCEWLPQSAFKPMQASSDAEASWYLHRSSLSPHLRGG